MTIIIPAGLPCSDLLGTRIRWHSRSGLEVTVQSLTLSSGFLTATGPSLVWPAAGAT